MAALMIQIILAMPIYTSIVFAQPQAEGPSIYADIPRYYNKNVIDIAGEVTPYSEMQIYVDGQLLMSLPRSETVDG